MILFYFVCILHLLEANMSPIRMLPGRWLRLLAALYRVDRWLVHQRWSRHGRCGCGYSKWSGFVIGRQWLIKLEQEKSYSHYSHPTIYRDTYVIIWILQMGNIAILDVLDQFLQMVPLLFPVISPKNQVNGSAPSTGSSGWPMGLAGGLQIWCRKSAWGKTSFYKWWKTIR